MTQAEHEPEFGTIEQYARPLLGFQQVPRLWLVRQQAPNPSLAQRLLHETVEADLDGHYDEVMTVLVNGVRLYRLDAIRQPVQVLHDHLHDQPSRRAALAAMWLIAAERQQQIQAPLVDRPPLYEV